MVSLKNLTKSKINLPWLDIATAILGEKYEVSLVLAGNPLLHKLNFTHRGKDKPTNVLSFPLSKTSGEIFISLPYTRLEAKTLGEDFNYRVGYLFIHGLLHLKGLAHGSTMDNKERLFSNRFLTNGSKHRHRHRSGDRLRSDSGRRVQRGK